MKARIRSIKPEAFVDEELWDLEEDTGFPVFRAFSGLWCHADRDGRFEWRPRALKAGILPYWSGDFSELLDALVSHGFLVRYEVNGREYGAIPRFHDHQYINNKEPPSSIPEPPKSDVHASVTREARVEHASLSFPRDADDASIPSVPFPSHTDTREVVPDRPPTSLPEALRWPLQARAQFAVDRADMAIWIQPEKWPETVEAAAISGEALGIGKPKLGNYGRDAGVRSLVSLFAAGFTLDDFREAAEPMRTDVWLSERRGLSSLTVEVMRRLQAKANPQEPVVAESFVTP
jgi:hypothetical protein